MSFLDDFVIRLGQTAQIPVCNENEYIGSDGLIHCKKCNGKLETIIKSDVYNMRVRCICDCDRAKREEFAKRERQNELDRIRSVCFHETNMKDWNFEHDDRSNPKISDAMMRYAENFKEYKAEGKGLLLYGTVGTGKTFYSACISNYLIDQGYRVLMTNFARLTNILQGKQYSDKQEYIDNLNRYSLLVIDDLGAERKSEYMQEQVFNIIDARYRSGLPMIITTNLTLSELFETKDLGYSRIYDRITERCIPVEIAGESRRRRAVAESFKHDREKLGL